MYIRISIDHIYTLGDK